MTPPSPRVENEPGHKNHTRNSSKLSGTNAMSPAWMYTQRGYALAQSIRQMRRHRFATLATLLVLSVTLALPSLLFFTSHTLIALNSKSVEGESLTAYLGNSVDDLQGERLAQDWSNNSSIESTRYISKSEALKELESSTDVKSIVDMLGTNPLPGAIVIYPAATVVTDPVAMEALADNLSTLPTVTEVQFDMRWVKRLQSVLKLVQLVGGLLAGFLTLTALLVIANTIRLELARRRRELEITKLLGAKPSFMRRSILYTGALYGLAGGVFACLISLITLNAIRQPADALSSLYQSAFQLNLPDFTQVLLVLGVSVLLGIVGAVCSLYGSSQQLTQSRNSTY